jgi:hypothetical protein
VGSYRTKFALSFYHKSDRWRDRVGVILMRVQTGRPRDLVLFPAEVRDFSLLLSVQTGCGAHTASNSMGTTGSFGGYSDRDVNLTTQINLCRI